MSSSNIPEIRLRLADSIAGTVLEFMQEEESLALQEENLRIAEDIAEEIIKYLNVEFKDEINSNRLITTTISKRK